jgi:hypothetical protein
MFHHQKAVKDRLKMWQSSNIFERQIITALDSGNAYIQFGSSSRLVSET